MSIQLSLSTHKPDRTPNFVPSQRRLVQACVHGGYRTGSNQESIRASQEGTERKQVFWWLTFFNDAFPVCRAGRSSTSAFYLSYNLIPFAFPPQSWPSRIHLQVEDRDLGSFLLVTSELRKAVVEGVSNGGSHHVSTRGCYLPTSGSLSYQFI